MIRALVIGAAVVLLLLATFLPFVWVQNAKARLADAQARPKAASAQVAVASAANEEYCTPQLQQILRRVLQSCGLIGGSGGRGCQPLEARNVATMSGSDFNALFTPMASRGGIVQFDLDGAELDQNDRTLVERVFADRRGASYFFVVARASPEGQVEYNRELSRRRAEKVMSHLQETFHDPELERQVGLLWLGEEYAQLESTFCDWQRSGTGQCRPDDLNRSAFVTWVDCRL